MKIWYHASNRRHAVYVVWSAFWACIQQTIFIYISTKFSLPWLRTCHNAMHTNTRHTLLYWYSEKMVKTICQESYNHVFFYETQQLEYAKHTAERVVLIPSFWTPSWASGLFALSRLNKLIFDTLIWLWQRIFKTYRSNGHKQQHAEQNTSMT